MALFVSYYYYDETSFGNSSGYGYVVLDDHEEPTSAAEVDALIAVMVEGRGVQKAVPLWWKTLPSR